MDAAPVVPAGWYGDPSGAPGMRYWNGNTWTQDFAHAPPVRKWTTGRVLALVGGVILTLLAVGGFGTAATAFRETANPDGFSLAIDLVIPAVLALVGLGMVVGALRRRAG